jgi:CubicO group peptidase (beta-lactamase class C family)
MMSSTEIHGHCDAKFAGVRDAFAANFANGLDVGASFAATINGETVIDLWGGHADEAKTKPWQRDTIVNVYSTTKTMTALTALLLADRGLLDFAAPVATYWPEFAANGKEAVTVGHLMSHTSGLSGFDEKIAPEELYDWDRITGLLAAQAPWWEPGSQPGYHAITQGYLVGEVVRRITGKSLGTVFREEIAGPLEADFHIGFGAELDDRAGELIPPGKSLGQELNGGDISKRTMGNPSLTALEPRTRAWRQAEIPAAGGFGNARSVAEIQSILANGGMAKGKRIMSGAGCRKVLEPQITGTDLVLGIPLRFGLGYGMPSPMLPLPHADTVYWGGWGGSLVVVDFEARACFAFVMNKMEATTTGDARTIGLMGAMFMGLLS